MDVCNEGEKGKSNKVGVYTRMTVEPCGAVATMRKIITEALREVSGTVRTVLLRHLSFTRSEVN